MMRPGAGLHADEARRQVGKPRFHLATRPFLAQHQGSTPIMAHDVERILADIDADHGEFAVEFLGHGVLLCLSVPPCQFGSLAGAGARPDHPILGHWPTVPAAIRCGSVFGMASGGSGEPQPRLTRTWWHTGNAR